MIFLVATWEEGGTCECPINVVGEPALWRKAEIERRGQKEREGGREGQSGSERDKGGEK